MAKRNYYAMHRHPDLALYYSTEDLGEYVDFFAPISYGTIIPAPLKACKMCVYSYDLYHCSNCPLWRQMNPLRRK